MNAWPDPLRLIEAHGRLGLFKCIAESDRGKGNGSDGSDTKVNDEDDDEMMEAEENAQQARYSLRNAKVNNGEPLFLRTYFDSATTPTRVSQEVLLHI